MRGSLRSTAAVAFATTAHATSLADVCTVANVQAALPANGTLNGINPIASSVVVNTVYNTSVAAGVGQTASSTRYNYCNVTLAYEHPGQDQVLVWYTFPEPSTYKNRFYVAGGFGYTLNANPAEGLAYGAASGATDAGYGALNGITLDEVVLTGNGSINWQNVHMFAYQGLGELTQLGKAILPGFYAAANTTSKIYTYFEGCSDGGRQGMSQVQRFGEEYDGAITGAPAFRQGQQQVNHLFSNVAEVTLDYFPPPCEMEKIMNLTIAACDPLDGRVDGVVSRSDLCQATFNVNSTVGEAYYCAPTTSTSIGFGFSKRQTTSTTPAQNGTISVKGAALAARIYEGMFNSKGQRVYLPWPIASEFTDATTAYNTDTGAYELDITSLGGLFVAKFLQEVDLDNLSSLDGVTYDTLQSWMTQGMVRYMDTLQTTLPDLTDFQSNGGKLIHYHGEADPSVPAASSIRYYNSVRDTMYPGSTYNESVTSIQEWYKFFLVPGAAHCGTNTFMPGPFPEDNMATMIKWVESGAEPLTLNATVTTGSIYTGEVQDLCAFPLRPMWTDNSTFVCEYDRASIDSYDYTLDAFLVPVY